MGGVRFEYRIEPMCQVRGGGRAHPHISPNPVHNESPRIKDEEANRQRSPTSKRSMEGVEQATLDQKTKYRGRE